MAIKTVLRMGDPRLLARSAELSQVPSAALDALVQDLRDTMRSYNGAGLAAPQIGVMQRVVVFGVQTNPRYPDAEPIPDTVLINPLIEVLDATQETGWEGCLSVPGMRGLVPRYRAIRYSGLDPQGERIERKACGFHARVVQHECDHLDGILYPRRMTDLSLLGFTDVLEASGQLTPMPCDDPVE